MRHLTIRQVPPELADALEAEKRVSRSVAQPHGARPSLSGARSCERSTTQQRARSLRRDVERGGVRRVRGGDLGHRADRPGALALSRYCLDTSAYSHLRRGDARVAELIDGADWIGISTIAVGELLRGFFAGSHRSRNESELVDFLADPTVETPPVDRDVAHIYAELMAALESEGTPLPSNDVWIAAGSIRAGAPLLTFDRHFREIGRVGTILLESEN